jgi:hypothetical protein
MTTCHPDIAHPVVKTAQGSACQAEVHYLAVKSIFRYLAATINDGIVFWHTEAVMSLPRQPTTTNHELPSRHHDNLLDTWIQLGVIVLSHEGRLVVL